MSDGPEAEGPSSAHTYFRAIEERFLRLRGAPLLLSGEDWQVARRWHEEEVPLELIASVLEELMSRRQARGIRDRVSSLRYFEAAVDAAWREIRDLSAVASRSIATPLDVAARLAGLVASLPSALPDRQEWAERLSSLAGRAEQVEAALTELDRELLSSALDGLDQEERDRIEAQTRQALGSLGGRLPAGERGLAEERLRHQALRRRLGLPVLSLFSPEASRNASRSE